MRPALFWLLALTLPCAARAEELPRFEFRDGDRVVFLGDDLIERDQKYGYLETMLTAENPDKAIAFRNLGWSGDTVFGDARAGFGTPADGFNRLKEHVLAAPPTVIVLGYGMAESFAGAAGLTRFVEGYNKLLDTLAPTKARLILLAPIAHEDLGRPLPDPTEHNKALKLYRDAIERIAKERGGRFIDLYALSQQDNRNGLRPLTQDGIHLNEFGAWWLADRITRVLWPRPEPKVSPPLQRTEWSLSIDKSGQVRSNNVRALKVEHRADGLRLEARVDALCVPLPRPTFTDPSELGKFGLKLNVDGLSPGKYALKIDGKPALVVASDVQWGDEGVRLWEGPDNLRVEQLRAVINEKNRLYFYRWRPQNETYLFGFRKHEQGNNAREIPLFDPLVAEKEKEIATLRVPVTHVYELVRESEAAK